MNDTALQHSFEALDRIDIMHMTVYISLMSTFFALLYNEVFRSQTRCTSDHLSEGQIKFYCYAKV